MKALNVMLGNKIRTDRDPRGFVIVKSVTVRSGNYWIRFDDGVEVVRFPDDDLIVYEEPGPHPNAEHVLASVYRELRDLLDGDVDAPNVWRWTAMRLTRRVAEVLPVEALQKVNAEAPLKRADALVGPKDSSGPSEPA